MATEQLTRDSDNLDLNQLLRTLNAVKQGDFSARMPIDHTAVAGKIADTLNDIIDQNERMAAELQRIGNVVGKEGKIADRASLGDVRGSWSDCVTSVNTLITDLVQPTAETTRVIRSVANGDLSQTIATEIEGRPLQGEFLQTANIVNTMVDRLGSFASEVTRVAREVGTEGKLGVQAEVQGVAGTWKDLTDNVNLMAGNLTGQVRNIAEVATAIANGDLSKKITVNVKGEILELKNTINTMVDQLSSFASEVTRVAREVGTEGKLGVQAEVKDVAGTWKDLTDSVNFMAGSLTAQVRNIAEVTTAIANGDLSKKITVDVKGEILELKNTINVMVDQLNGFASEVTRVAREVGTEGKLGGQAQVRGVAGTWKDLTDNVNLMAANLTGQVRNIAEVTTAVARGDLSKKITVDVKGEILELKNTINTMVDQLNAFASEVTRVAREVGTEGKLGGQAQVPGVAGTWKDLTDNVNLMADNLTGQVRNIAEVTTAVARGDLSKKITVDVKGEILELKNTINVMVDQLNSFASEVTRVAREVGTEGKLGVQAYVRGVAGTWKDLTDTVNSMAGNLTGQVRNIAEVTKAVANGDLSKKITVDAKGEILDLKNTTNTMVDQLSSFASEVTRVAREVGTEGKLGGQAQVQGVAGTWKDLTDNVNSMAGNLTAQVRGIARVVTAVANGDLKRKLMLDAKGEIETLAETINEMIDTLATFANQVTTVAREVGIEGKLGGQARVPGAAGTWKDLTDNVNELAATLTTQLRAIAEVATAVTKGDLTRSIAVEAQGEVAILKDNINQMIANLRETTQKNTEQDWLKTNLAKFTRMLQGQRDLETVSKLILSELAPLVGAQHGVFFLMESAEHIPFLKLISSYAYRERRHLANRFYLGEGLVGQCALEKERILLTDVPSDYVRIASGLGEASPLNAVVLPVLFEGQVTAVIELASFRRFSEIHLTFFDQLTESIAIVLNTIAASMRTEELLKQSQSLAEELQTQQSELRETNQRLEQQAQSLKTSEDLLKGQQEELQQTNAELEEKAELMAMQKKEVERKNREIEQARLSLEDKAEQLALSSKYKSEFLANMSHELRTPLNSLLILAKLLTDNIEQNLSAKQVEYSQTIYSAGTDLLMLINDILDLAKIESGTMSIDMTQMPLAELGEQIERNFRQIAQSKGLDFRIELTPELPVSIYTDVKRIQQVLKNILSNAFKFTERGEVRLQIAVAKQGWNNDHQTLNSAQLVIAFSVSDTGIGIAPEKQKVIFEAFQQADGSTSRRYGGTGLGLSISREIARLFGGEIKLISQPGQGSTFTFYLPQLSPVSDSGAFSPSRSLSFDSASTLLTPYSLLSTEAINRVSIPSPLLNDDRTTIERGDRVLLIVEDDINFARILLDMAQQQGFKVIAAHTGSTGLMLAQQFLPSAILLDIRLPEMDGWTVLDRLKHDPNTRHIPVHIMTIEEGRQRGLQLGAIAYLQKPLTSETISEALTKIKGFVERQVKNLLVVEDDDTQRLSIVELIGNSDVSTTAVADGVTALEAIRTQHFDCLVLDLGLPDMTGFELIEQIKLLPHGKTLPIIVYTGREISKAQETELRRIAETIIIKDVRSPERLLDETALFLHRVQANLPAPKREILEQLHSIDHLLAGKKALIVDDDMRNIFALTSMLERYQIQVLYAENGREGIALLETTPDIDVVLMDVMMPEMDGYETTRLIRQNEQFKSLPIIALTAKAMQGDREKCIEAGASDYITKPVDTEQLLSLLRVWLYR
ncbi:histidine kinase [Nostoc cf. commune SO-36]|uniref:histidine kinase n=1 Tax=Nostoc cf. commune SO-36 TaxID=449208 RepID=A0ABM7Z3T1_NOSCO|nr:HAMP domain-containing protein [Nostoc commune]BDI17680.1 histidine kinase [Nostoc cf. commune SO-36]